MHSFPSGAPHWEEDRVIAEPFPTTIPPKPKNVMNIIPRAFALMGNLLAYVLCENDR